MSSEPVLKLFNSETKCLITWNLVVHKELNAKKLSILLDKDISTINRTLNKMKKDNLIQISHTEEISNNKANFRVNYWQLVPDLLPDLSEMEKIIINFLEEKNSGAVKEIKILFGSTKGIILSAMTQKFENILVDKKISPISFILFDEKVGQEYEKAYWQFIKAFMQKYQPKQIPLEKIDPTGYIVFNFASQIKDTIKKTNY